MVLLTLGGFSLCIHCDMNQWPTGSKTVIKHKSYHSINNKLNKSNKIHSPTAYTDCIITIITDMFVGQYIYIEIYNCLYKCTTFNILNIRAVGVPMYCRQWILLVS